MLYDRLKKQFSSNNKEDSIDGNENELQINETDDEYVIDIPLSTLISEENDIENCENESCYGFQSQIGDEDQNFSVKENESQKSGYKVVRYPVNRDRSGSVRRPRGVSRVSADGFELEIEHSSIDGDGIELQNRRRINSQDYYSVDNEEEKDVDSELEMTHPLGLHLLSQGSGKGSKPPLHPRGFHLKPMKNEDLAKDDIESVESLCCPVHGRNYIVETDEVTIEIDDLEKGCQCKELIDKSKINQLTHSQPNRLGLDGHRMVRIYLKKLKGVPGKAPPKPSPPHEVVMSVVLSFVAILIVSVLAFFVVGKYFQINGEGVIFLSGSFAASAVLLYDVYESPLAQPRNVFGGYLISSIIGVSCQKLFSQVLSLPQWLSGSFAVSFSIFAMNYTRTVHPPGGACALIAVIGGNGIINMGYYYVLTSISAAAIMILIAVLINNITPTRKYPTFWY